jgi:hypothetical protein
VEVSRVETTSKKPLLRLSTRRKGASYSDLDLEARGKFVKKTQGIVQRFGLLMETLLIDGLLSRIRLRLEKNSTGHALKDLGKLEKTWNSYVRTTEGLLNSAREAGKKGGNRPLGSAEERKILFAEIQREMNRRHLNAPRTSHEALADHISKNLSVKGIAISPRTITDNTKSPKKVDRKNN